METCTYCGNSDGQLFTISSARMHLACRSAAVAAGTPEPVATVAERVFTTRPTANQQRAAARAAYYRPSRRVTAENEICGGCGIRGDDGDCGYRS